jgi:hypothetical protein
MKIRVRTAYEFGSIQPKDAKRSGNDAELARANRGTAHWDHQQHTVASPKKCRCLSQAGPTSAA